MFPFRKMRLQKSKMADPRWPPPKNFIVNPDVSAGCHGNQVNSYDVRYQCQALCKVWSLYLESKSKDIRKTYFGI